jgi:hypothetical protein
LVSKIQIKKVKNTTSNDGTKHAAHGSASGQRREARRNVASFDDFPFIPVFLRGYTEPWVSVADL